MAKSYRTLQEKLAARRAGDATREARFAAYQSEARHAVALADLRRARNLTQQQLAHALDTTQSGISRLEHQTDLYLSTLRSFIEAMGGHLEIEAVFADQRLPIKIEADDDLADGEAADDRAAAQLSLAGVRSAH
jgi:transcriptional regulator with XRE-family HTH domain